ncbi:MAG TPA: ATP-grasp domain-containing protein, partial [Candidatus Limnocylindrales bacterium]|nr:ATP-grasp domain-containing protein [Candidatus Limnocylindrales bacterium]
CINKKETQKQLHSLGIPIPKVYTRQTARFPCVVKPSYGSGANGVAIVHNRSEMDRHLAKIKEPIIQEYIDGPEYSVDVFADLNAIPLSIVPRVRIHTESGVSMKGETVYDKKIIDYCELIVRKLHLVGPTCIQCIKGKNGIRFLEINIRFGGGSVLSLTANPSVVSNLVKIARGQRPIPHREFKKGLIMLRYYSQAFVTRGKVLKK